MAAGIRDAKSYMTSILVTAPLCPAQVSYLLAETTPVLQWTFRGSDDTLMQQLIYHLNNETRKRVCDIWG